MLGSLLDGYARLHVAYQALQLLPSTLLPQVGMRTWSYRQNEIAYHQKQLLHFLLSREFAQTYYFSITTFTQKVQKTLT